MEQILAIHHTATPRDRTSVEAIVDYHTKPVSEGGRGYGRLFYQDLFTPSGRYHAHDELNYRGAGAVSKDICIVANAEIESPYFRQRYEAGRVIRDWIWEKRDPKLIFGHSELKAAGYEASESACPGRIMEQLALWPRMMLNLRVLIVEVSDDASLNIPETVSATQDFLLPMLRVTHERKRVSIEPSWKSAPGYQSGYATIDNSFYREHIEPLADGENYDVVALIVKDAWWRGGSASGWRRSFMYNDKSTAIVEVRGRERSHMIGALVRMPMTADTLIHEICHALYWLLYQKLGIYLQDTTHAYGEDYYLNFQHLLDIKQLLPSANVIPGHPIDAEEPSPLEVATAQAIESFRRHIGGPLWAPSSFFYERGLVDRGVIGAVRVIGHPNIKPYHVYSLGPAGRRETWWSYRTRFGTSKQVDNQGNPIVGTIQAWQAPLVDIRP